MYTCLVILKIKFMEEKIEKEFEYFVGNKYVIYLFSGKYSRN